jgi:hypothetical protein
VAIIFYSQCEMIRVSKRKQLGGLHHQKSYFLTSFALEGIGSIRKFCMTSMRRS